MDLETAKQRINALEKSLSSLKGSKDNLKVRAVTDFIQSNEAIKERIVLDFSKQELGDMTTSLAEAQSDEPTEENKELVGNLEWAVTSIQNRITRLTTKTPEALIYKHAVEAYHNVTKFLFI